MSKTRDFKKLVRARMAETGESYTTARAALLAKKETVIMLPDPIVGLRESPLVRALRGENMPPVRMSLEGWRCGDQLRKQDGQDIPIMMDGKHLGTASMQVRADGIYFGNVRPTDEGKAWAENPRITGAEIPIAGMRTP